MVGLKISAHDSISFYPTKHWMLISVRASVDLRRRINVPSKTLDDINWKVTLEIREELF